MSNEEFARRFGVEGGEFYITAPAPCPYLTGKRERKIFSYLGGDAAAITNAQLTQRGFRRSQNIIYLPACEGCNACVPVRIVVDGFESSKSRRRISSKNEDLERKICAPRATAEQFSTLRGYLDSRHSDGGMADMTVLDYASMVEETSVDTMVVEYRRKSTDDRESPITAVALTDRLIDGLSMVYSFFEPDEANRSLGTYMILDHIKLARQLSLPYVYLGYWVNGSQKMDYKSRFQPLEKLGPDGWTPLDIST